MSDRQVDELDDAYKAACRHIDAARAADPRYVGRLRREDQRRRQLLARQAEADVALEAFERRSGMRG